MSDQPTVTVEVDTPEPTPVADSGTDVVVVNPPESDSGSEDIALIVGGLVQRVSNLEERVSSIGITADVAIEVADAAIETANVAAEVSEEAVEVAEEAAEETEVTEPPDEPPGKTHWLHRPIREWRGRE